MVLLEVDVGTNVVQLIAVIFDFLTRDPQFTKKNLLHSALFILSTISSFDSTGVNIPFPSGSLSAAASFHVYTGHGVPVPVFQPPDPPHLVHWDHRPSYCMAC